MAPSKPTVADWKLFLATVEDSISQQRQKCHENSLKFYDILSNERHHVIAFFQASIPSRCICENNKMPSSCCSHFRAIKSGSGAPH